MSDTNGFVKVVMQVHLTVSNIFIIELLHAVAIFPFGNVINEKLVQSADMDKY